MQGSVAQAIALTLYGNAFLAQDVGSPEFLFYPSNSCFAFCEFVRFVVFKPQGDEWKCKDYAETPTAWFERLKEDGVRHLRLYHFPSNDGWKSDRMSVGFIGGGGRWLIETERPQAPDCWEIRWELGDRERADQKIWRVTYGRLRNCAVPKAVAPSLADVKSALKQTLSEIATFARQNRLDEFAEKFESSLARLDSPTPWENLHHDDLAPPRLLSPPGGELLAAAQSAWVFGGMGSWNDLSFAGKVQRQYESLSDDLFLQLHRAVVVAVNSSAPAVGVQADKPWWRFW